MKTTVIEFRWTVSKGRDTYGYNICSLYANGAKQTSTDGGGYDMEGVCFGNYLKMFYSDRIIKLRAGDFYGLLFTKETKYGSYKRLKRYSDGCNIEIDGACGMSSMVSIAKAIGLTIQFISRHNDNTTHLLTDNKG